MASHLSIEKKMGSDPERHMIFWPRGLAGTNDKIKNIKSPLPECQQFVQDGNLSVWAPAQKVVWHLIAWS